MKKTITLFLMTQKGYEVLRALTENFPKIHYVVIASRDSNVQEDYYNKIKGICSRRGVAFYDRKDSYKINGEYVMAISWRWLIKLPSAKIIVLHDSLLPRYRGFNPLVSALINGEKKIGVTALLASEEYDKGEIISQFSAEISYPIKIQQAIEIIIKKYVKVSLQIARKIELGEKIESAPQNETEASYSLWRDDDDYHVDWTRSSEEIKRFIDAVGFPYKCASTKIGDTFARILDAEIIEDLKIENRTPGKVIFFRNSKPVVVCGKGLLQLNEIVDDQNGTHLFPLLKFRSRFK